MALGDDREEVLKASGKDDGQEATRTRADILEGVNLMARQQGDSALPDLNNFIAAPDPEGPFDHVADLILPTVAVQGRGPVPRHNFLDHGSIQEWSGRILPDNHGLAEDIEGLMMGSLRSLIAGLGHLVPPVTDALATVCAQQAGVKTGLRDPAQVTFQSNRFLPVQQASGPQTLQFG